MVCLPNIVCKQMFIPEFLHRDFNARRLVNLTKQILSSDSELNNFKKKYEFLRKSLSDTPNPYQKTAKLINDFLMKNNLIAE